MIAIISDIHANQEALEAVLKDIEHYGIEDTFCLGDIVNYGPDPNSVIELLIKNRVKCIMGNHDYSVIDPINGYTMIRAAMQDSLNYTLDTLKEENLKFLEDLSWTKSEYECYFVHCSPPDRLRGHIREFIEDDSFDTIIQSTNQDICFVGHTHKEMIYAEIPYGESDHTRIPGCTVDQRDIDRKLSQSSYTAGEFDLDLSTRYIINVGSIGFHKGGSQHASYCLFNPKTKKLIYRHIHYDIASLMNKLKKLDLTTDVERFVAKYLPIEKLWAH